MTKASVAATSGVAVHVALIVAVWLENELLTKVSTDSVIWVWTEGEWRSVVRTGDYAPGTSGRSFQYIYSDSILLNNLGEVAFIVRFDNFDFAVYTEDGPGNLVPVAIEGDQAPGSGAGTFSGNFYGPAFNDAGQVAFGARDSRSGPGSGSDGIWTGTKGDLRLVAHDGTQSPGTLSDFFGFDPPVISSSGAVAFRASYNGGGDMGIWRDIGGNLQLVASSQIPPPGFGGEVTITPSYNALFINAAGDVAFRARISGPGKAYDDSIWVQEAGGELKMIAREGGTLEVAPGVFRTIDRLSFSGRTGDQSSSGTPLNNLGQVVFGAHFTDGSEAVFQAGRPAPTLGEIDRTAETFTLVGGNAAPRLILEQDLSSLMPYMDDVDRLASIQLQLDYFNLQPHFPELQPGLMAGVGPTLYFISDVGGTEQLWKSNGTAAGTVMVKDINPIGSSHPRFLTYVNGALYFTANDGSNGWELWVVKSE